MGEIYLKPSADWSGPAERMAKAQEEQLTAEEADRYVYSRVVVVERSGEWYDKYLVVTYRRHEATFKEYDSAYVRTYHTKWRAARVAKALSRELKKNDGGTVTYKHGSKV